MHWHHCEGDLHIGNQPDYSQHAPIWLLHLFSRPKPSSSWETERNCLYTFHHKCFYLEKENICSGKKIYIY